MQINHRKGSVYMTGVFHPQAVIIVFKSVLVTKEESRGHTVTLLNGRCWCQTHQRGR